MKTDWFDEALTDEQRARYRSCWALIDEGSERTYALRPYLYEQFFAPDAQTVIFPCSFVRTQSRLSQSRDEAEFSTSP